MVQLKVCDEFRELKMDARSARQKSYVNKRIQKKGQDILRIFFAQVDLAKEYVLLYHELNNLIPKYTKLIRTRATLNKKRAAAKAKAAAEAQPKEHIVSVNGKETGLVTIAGE